MAEALEKGCIYIYILIQNYNITKRVSEETIKRLTLAYVMSCSLPVHRIEIGIWLDTIPHAKANANLFDPLFSVLSLQLEHDNVNFSLACLYYRFKYVIYGDWMLIQPKKNIGSRSQWTTRWYYWLLINIANYLI